ncbi:MAG: phosphoenolpyruvate synthase [Bacteroidetes bacterium]|nr:phosphoenolpyruvate synthase [Bacteroidota bacterium]
MNRYVLFFEEIDRKRLPEVGGKGANLGELSRIEGIRVPEGFCVTTEAYKKVTEANRKLDDLLDDLARLNARARKDISEVSARIRSVIENIPIPRDIADEIGGCLEHRGAWNAYAVRSSATAEDLPTASFAGQQDTYLNCIGNESILGHVSKCWASLFTDRAVTYRLQNGFDHRVVRLSVVIQKMVFPRVSGILFTADPLTSNRKVMSIDAGFGTGDALVSGLVNADNYSVREGRVIVSGQRGRRVLTDEQVLELERIGRKIEGHFGYPQDIEWCLADDGFYILQSRPITTLYPVPVIDDNEAHVFVSVGHQQMMTDAMKPLGLSLFRLTAGRPMYTAGGRLFVDIAPYLATSAGRETMLGVLGKSDPLIKDALLTLIERDFIPLLPGDGEEAGGSASPLPDFKALNDYDPAVVDDLVRESQASIGVLKRSIRTRSGLDMMDLILEDIKKRKTESSDPRSFGVIMTAMNAASWLNEKMMEWLGEKNVADTLTQSVSNNITSEMGLELLDVADKVRCYPEVVAYLQGVREDDLLDGLDGLEGGKAARDAISAYLEKYGMRCAGEIDITKSRWSEKPGALVAVLVSNIKNFEPGAGRRKFEEGLRAALKMEQVLLDRLRQLPDGEQKAMETKRMIGLVRHLAGYREYPKYGIVSRYAVYKEALMREAQRLVQANIIEEKEDIYYLSYEELREVVRTNRADRFLICQRKEEFRVYGKMTPPRVITSEGEVITGVYRREGLPAGAIAGLPVSSGVVEGRARVILDMEDADLGGEDILVTAFTDPSWTPLFVSIKGLVTEVGGLMTHGAVIAREYGLPAVVGVENATKLIKNGQRIRVNGTDGYVELL